MCYYGRPAQPMMCCRQLIWGSQKYTSNFLLETSLTLHYKHLVKLAYLIQFLVRDFRWYQERNVLKRFNTFTYPLVCCKLYVISDCDFNISLGNEIILVFK